LTLTVDGPAAQHESPIAAATNEAGLRTAVFTPSQDGIYQVTARATWPDGRVETASTAVLVGGADVEMSEPCRHDATLARLAEESGGTLVPEENLDPLRALVQSAARAPELCEARHWHNPWVFILLAAMLSAEWILR